jgi:hypothetical protein
MKQRTANSNSAESGVVGIRENPQALAGQQQGDKRIGNYLVGKSFGPLLTRSAKEKRLGRVLLAK